MSRVSKIKYNPHLSISENAKNNGVSEAGIRYHIQSHFIDRRKEAKTNVINSIKKYLNEHPNASRNEIHKELGYSLSTIRKYWPFVVGEKRLTEHNSKKKDNQYQQYVNKLSQIPIGVIRKYLAEQEESGKQVSKPKLTICRKCIQDGTEPDIDYKLLRSKHIHLLGKELTFDKPLDIK